MRREWGNHRALRIVKSKDYILQDLWKNKPYHGYLYSSAFTESIFFHEKEPAVKQYHAHSVLLNVICPYVSNHQSLVVSGNCKELGEWDLKRAKPLKHVNDGEWSLLLNARELAMQSYYKFVIIDKNTGQAVHWEDGGNRILTPRRENQSSSVFAEMGLVYHYNGFTFKGVGTAIPVFSLKTSRSFGIGDFTDLREMVDWAAMTGQQLIQLLPVNDTTTTKTWKDSYPYSAISNFALHPLYLGCGDFPLKNKRKYQRFLKEAKQLNERSLLEYEKVHDLKRGTAGAIRSKGEKILASNDFRVLYRKRTIAFPYACYCYLRDQSRNTNFRNGEFGTYSANKLQQLVEDSPEVKKETRYWCLFNTCFTTIFGVKASRTRKE